MYFVATIMGMTVTSYQHQTFKLLTVVSTVEPWQGFVSWNTNMIVYLEDMKEQVLKTTVKHDSNDSFKKSWSALKLILWQNFGHL